MNGTGFGGSEAAFYLRKRLGKRVQVTMVGASEGFLFEPNTVTESEDAQFDKATFAQVPLRLTVNLEMPGRRARGAVFLTTHELHRSSR